MLHACMSTHTHEYTKHLMTQTQIEVFRGGQEGQEDLLGDERGGGEEEGGREEALLSGVEAQEAYCGRRHQGVQVTQKQRKDRG